MGKQNPAKLLPPPTQAISVVWYDVYLLELLHDLLTDDGLMQHDMIGHAAQEYLVLGWLTQVSIASEMAIPSEPELSGFFSRNCRPKAVSLLGKHRP